MSLSREKKPSKPQKQTKFSLIVDTIASRVALGKLKERDRLPSEQRLAATFQVSLGTVQKALAELTHQGLIVREHGRGTFVAPSRRSPAELHYLRFRDRLGNDLPLYVLSHKVKSIRQQGPWSTFLGSPHSFVRVQRVINAGGMFEVFSEFILREDEFAAVHDLKSEALEQLSLRDTLRQRFSLPTLRVEQHIGVEVLPEKICTSLGLPSRTTGLVMELLGYTTNDRPFCYQRVFTNLQDSRLIVPR